MFAKIVSFSESKGVLAPYWEFEYFTRDSSGQTTFGSLSTHEAIRLAASAEGNAIFEMCRVIKDTPPADYSWLVGRVFQGRTTVSVATLDRVPGAIA
jgi:hypothetical protein